MVALLAPIGGRQIDPVNVNNTHGDSASHSSIIAHASAPALSHCFSSDSSSVDRSTCLICISTEIPSGSGILCRGTTTPSLTTPGITQRSDAMAQTSWLIPFPGIEGIAQAVAQEIEGQHCDHDHEAGKEGNVREAQDIGSSIGQGAAPGRVGRSDTQAQE